MPLVPCPKCSTNLKVPDGATAAVRCPKCQTVFQPPKPQPAFEVVDDAPPPARPKPAPPRPAAQPPARPAAPKSAARPAAASPEFEVVDAPAPPRKTVTARPADEDDRPRSKRRDEEDEDDDRPRRKGRREEDEDDDRPRSRRSRDDEDDRPRKRRQDDDDEDDRPRSRRSRDDDDDRRGRSRRRDDDYDDDYDDRSRRGGKSGAGPAKIGLLLISISLWAYLGAFALLVFFLLLLWAGVGLPYGLFTIPGLVGMANWIVALVGGGFAIAGPARCRGLAVAAVSVAAVHLILTFVAALESGKGLSVFQGAAAMSHFAKAERIGERLRKNPNDQQVWKEAQEFQKEEADALRSWEKPSLRWEDFGTVLPDFDGFLLTLIYNSKTFGDQILRILAGACELARLILLVLLLKSLARAVKSGDAEDKARMGVMAVSIGAGVCVVVLLLFGIIAHETKFDSLRTPLNLAIGAGMLVYLIHAGVLVFPALAAQQAHSAAARRR